MDSYDPYDCVEDVVKGIIGGNAYSVSMGVLEQRIEHLFPPEERENDAPAGLPDAMSLAGTFFLLHGWREVNEHHFSGYQKIDP